MGARTSTGRGESIISNCFFAQDEVTSVRVTYEQQIGVLSDHLADLNAKLEAANRKK